MAMEWRRRTARVQHKVKNLQTRLANAEKVANGKNFANLLKCVSDSTCILSSCNIMHL
jgi:hypothetical protein